MIISAELLQGGEFMGFTKVLGLLDVVCVLFSVEFGHVRRLVASYF